VTWAGTSGRQAGRAAAALLTSPARGGIAVIALGGPGAGEVLDRVFRPRGAAPAAGRLSLGWIVHDGQGVDEAIVAELDGGGGYEINIHGGPRAARAVLTALREMGAEVARPGRIDPALVKPHGRWENPAIAAEMLQAIRRAMTPLAASAVAAQWSGGISALAATAPEAPALRQAARAAPLMRRLLDPAEVVIAGPPNAGKSALANALAGRRASIVSESPGTTRDWVRLPAEADGVPIWLTDTAGLWAPPGGVDAEAVRRAWGRIESADLVICLRDPTGPADENLRRLKELTNVLVVGGKCDLAAPPPGCELGVSGLTMVGLTPLRRAIRGRLGFGRFDPLAAMAFTDRQERLLTAAADAVEARDGESARAALHELLAGA